MSSSLSIGDRSSPVEEGEASGRRGPMVTSERRLPPSRGRSDEAMRWPSAVGTLGAMSSVALVRASFDRERHLPLLLEADDVEEHIHEYLDRGQLFEIREADGLIGVAVLVADADAVEIWSIALSEEQRGRG